MITTYTLAPLHNPTSQENSYLVLGQSELLNAIEVGRRYNLTEESYLLSNRKDADIQIPSDAIPEYRVMLYRSNLGWSFENLGERRDVCLNGFPNQEGALRDGDFLQIGQTIFEFLAGVGIQSNIFEAMDQAIRVDAHTKAYNKKHFWENLGQWIALSERHEQELSLVMIDIDHFKKLNTDYGHLVADEVLKLFAQRIRSRLRQGDSFYRVGGEEFTVILPKTPISRVITLAEELRRVVEKDPFVYQDQQIQVTISLGVASYQKKMTDKEFYETADKRLREAKATGRNKVVW